MRFFKNMLTGSLTAVFIFALSFSALAAAPDDDSVYIRQSGSGMCTLASATMVLRNAARLSGEEDWQQITEDAVRPYAWVEGTGLSWDISYGNFHMVQTGISSTDELAELVKAHPEGIVAYDSWYPHAIFLTDYDEETGIFYCADPAEGTPAGRIPVSESLIRAENVDAAWYLTEAVEIPEKEEISTDEKKESAIKALPAEETKESAIEEKMKEISPNTIKELAAANSSLNNSAQIIVHP